MKQLCEKNNILLVVDEVQTGFGRTGKHFAVEHWNVVPDILVMAKGIASGYPISGIVSRSDLMEKQPPGSMGGTYAGNAVACAAAVATLDVFKEEKILENVNKQGKTLIGALKEMQKKYPVIGDVRVRKHESLIFPQVRGLGLMIGVEFDTNHPKVKKGFANEVSQACLRHKMLLLTTGVYETIRFIPPLIVNDEEVKMASDIFEKALQETLATK